MQDHGSRDDSTAVFHEMSLPKRHAELKLIRLEAPLNEHILKLLAFDMPDERRAYFRKEIRKWLREIQTIRLKDNDKPSRAGWYYGLLYDGPLGGVEEQNVATICEGIEDYHEGSLARNATPVERLRALHKALAERAATGLLLVELAETL